MLVLLPRFSSSRAAASPSSLWRFCGVVVSRVRTSSSIHRFRRRRFLQSRRFWVWWCTRLVVLWSPFPLLCAFLSGRQRWIGRWVYHVTTISSPTPPRPLWTKSSVVTSKSKRKREEEAFFWGSRQHHRGDIEATSMKARCPLHHNIIIITKRGKRKGTLPCATRQDTRALARCTRPRCRTRRRFDRAQPRSTFFLLSSSSSFLRSSSFRFRRFLRERSTT